MKWKLGLDGVYGVSEFHGQPVLAAVAADWARDSLRSMGFAYVGHLLADPAG